MKFGIRIPSIKKRLSAKTSIKRYLRHSVGLKAPRGLGIVTDPKRALYNRIYNKTSISMDKIYKKAISNEKPIYSNNWNTGNFKTKEDLLNKAKKTNIVTNKINCSKCGSDLWAIANVKLLFWNGDAIFCQNCGRPNSDTEGFEKYISK